MKKLFILSAIALAALSGCTSGGNGNGSPGTPTTPSLTHNQLAELFVRELNADGTYSVNLAKDSTLQTNYIVIYDIDLDEYDAVNIDTYAPGVDPVTYIESAAAAIFFDLDVIPAHYEYEPYSYYDYYCDCYLTDVREVYIPTRYRDRFSGLVFEKINSTNKDLHKIAALAEEKVVLSRAENVASRFGLSVDRSKEVVRLAMAWKKAGGKNLTAKDQDAFSKELLGFSITEAKKASENYLAGDKASLDQLVEKAAESNSTSPENVRQVISEYFGI